jgi:hypothetical protein
LLITGPDNKGTVQAAGVSDVTIRGINFEEEMIARNLRIIVVQAKVGFTACVVSPQQEVVWFDELKRLALLWSFYATRMD